jgi:predicted SnoaL-like aldol condensation-catalyzing enzyme
MKGIAIWRIENGKIKEHWDQTDELGVMIQLGAFQPPH